MGTLEEYGFLNVELNESYSNLCEVIHKVIPKAKEIATLGKEQIVSKEKWRFLDRSLLRDGRYVGWHMGELFREGTYGKIYKAFRMVVARRHDSLFDVAEAPHEVIVKQSSGSSSSVLPDDEVTAHTSEALLHVLAWQTMQKTVAPWSIPRPFEVFGDWDTAAAGWKSLSLCMSYVRGRTLYSYADKFWKRSSKAENARSFIEILAQVAFILYHLQERLRLNHRDVKVNNIMVRTRKEPVILTIGDAHMTTLFEVTLIDFGFACVGCPPPQQPMTAFQAGSWFPMSEICCKVGRDIAQLLFCINCYFPLKEFLPKELFDLLHSRLQISWLGGMADLFNGFTKDGRPRPPSESVEYNTGIYEFLRRSEVDPAACAPLAIFRDCCEYAG